MEVILITILAAVLILIFIYGRTESISVGGHLLPKKYDVFRNEIGGTINNNISYADYAHASVYGKMITESGFAAAQWRYRNGTLTNREIDKLIFR